MHLTTLRVEIEVEARIRTKRKTIRLILAKIHRSFNVSIAELEGEGHPSRSTLGIAALGSSRREVRSALGRIADALVAHPRLEILEVTWTDH